MIHYNDSGAGRCEEQHLLPKVGMALLKLTAFYAAGAAVFVTVMTWAGAQLF